MIAKFVKRSGFLVLALIAEDIRVHGKAFFATGHITTFSASRETSLLEIHTRANFTTRVSEGNVSVITLNVESRASGPVSKEFCYNPTALFQVIEWPKELLKGYDKGGLYDNTHIVSVLDRGEIPKGLDLAQLISWCTFASQIKSPRGPVAPNPFPDVSGDSAPITNATKVIAFSIPIKFDIVRAPREAIVARFNGNLTTNLLKTDSTPYIGAHFKTTATTNFSNHILPLLSEIELLGRDKTTGVVRTVDNAVLVVDKWELDKNEGPLLPTAPPNSTIVDERPGVEGEKVHELGEVGWDFIRKTKIAPSYVTAHPSGGWRVVWYGAAALSVGVLIYCTFGRTKKPIVKR